MTPQQQDWALVALGLVAAALLLAHAGGVVPAADPNQIARYNAWIEHCVKTDADCQKALK